MLSLIADFKNLETALRKVLTNREIAGIDGMSFLKYKKWFNTHYKEHQPNLKVSTYKGTIVKVKIIDKPDGIRRKLGIPTVKGCPVQQAISQVLSTALNLNILTKAMAFDFKEIKLIIRKRMRKSSRTQKLNS